MSKKDSHYLRHDYNSTQDPKLVAIRQKYGMEGYGIYWALCEWLRQQADGMVKTTEITAFVYNLQCSYDTTKSIVEDFDLFVIDNDFFYSERLNRDTEAYNSLKQKRIDAGRSGGLAKAEQNSSNAIASGKQTPSSKVKNSKEKESKYIDVFDLFWNLYPSRNGKKLEKTKTAEAFFKIHEKHYDNIITSVKNYANDYGISQGIGIRDPKRFLKDNYYEEYLLATPQTTNSGKTADTAKDGAMTYNKEQKAFAWLKIVDGKEVWTNPTPEQIEAHKSKPCSM